MQATIFLIPYEKITGTDVFATWLKSQSTKEQTITLTSLIVVEQGQPVDGPEQLHKKCYITTAEPRNGMQ